MKNLYLSSLIAAAALGLTACGDSTSSNSIFSDALVTTDIAASSGDAAATAVDNMVLAESDVSLSAPAALSSAAGISRTRTCYDANGAVVAGCSPIASVRKIVTHVAIDITRDGSSSTTGGPTVTWSGAVHRVADDTTKRNYNTAQPPAEISRTHSGVSVAHDTTSFTGDTISRKHAEAAHDSFNALTWNLPRSSNPWPVSGTIMRLDSIHATFTKGSLSESRDVVRTVEVDFPADAQGNVVLKVNGKTCNLNLVSHKVTACS